MNRVISTSELNVVAENIIRYCSDKIDALFGLKPPLYNFEANSLLEGLAWNTARGQVSNHLIVIGGAIMAYESMQEDAYQLQSILGGESELYNEAFLLERLEYANRRIHELMDANNTWFRLMLSIPEDTLEISRLVNANQDLIDDYIDFRTLLEKRLQRLNEISGATQSLFVRSKSLFDDVNAGLEHLGGTWNGSMFLWHIDAPWRTNLKKAWDERIRTIAIRDFKEGGFKYLNQEFWGREDGFFDDMWWLNPDKLAIAIGVLLFEAELLGGINLDLLFSELGRREDNIRIQAFQALLFISHDAIGTWCPNSFYVLFQALDIKQDTWIFDRNQTLSVENLQFMIREFEYGMDNVMLRVWREYGPFLIIGCLGGYSSVRMMANRGVTRGPRKINWSGGLGGGITRPRMGYRPLGLGTGIGFRNTGRVKQVQDPLRPPGGGTGGNKIRTWTSSDKHVGNTANAIERKFPGRVKSVNRKIHRSDGSTRAEFDIELNDTVIQVKSGTGKGATKQAKLTAENTNKEVVVFLPDKSPNSAIVRGLESEGFRVFTNLQDLLNGL